MNILAIETSSPQGTIALQANNSVQQITLQQPRQQLSEILPTIESLLSQQNLLLQQLDVLTFSMGPGSFTGIRIALGIIQGLALATAIPVAAISSLRVLAQTAWRLHNYRHVFCCVNAYMQQLYIAAYELHKDHLMHPVIADQLLSPVAVKALSLFKYHGVGDAWQAYATKLQCDVVDETLLFPQAQDLITLLPLTKITAIDEVVAHYLRGKEAWQKPG